MLFSAFIVGLLVIVALGIFSFVRIELVFRAQMKALCITSDRARADIDAQQGKDWHRHYDILNSYGSFERMLFDLRKWTFKQFYPGL